MLALANIMPSMEKNEILFKTWVKIQARLIEELLISGAPYWDILEIISGSISFKNGCAWYAVPDVHRFERADA